MKEKNEILCVMCVYNEERNVVGCLSHLSPYVDGFVIFDDGSTDDTRAIVKREKKLRSLLTNNDKSAWRERSNREAVLREAKRVSDTAHPWVLCVDPDERFETRFLKELRRITAAREGEGKVLHLHTRELWGSVNTYRADGIWNNKLKGCLFQLNETMTFDYEREHHIPWAYREIAHNQEVLDYNFYHLKMVHAADRQRRADLYNRLDPKREMQPIGYDYLVDAEGLVLVRIPFSKRYNRKSVPRYYKKK